MSRRSAASSSVQGDELGREGASWDARMMDESETIPEGGNASLSGHVRGRALALNVKSGQHGADAPPDSSSSSMFIAQPATVELACTLAFQSATSWSGLAAQQLTT